MAITVDLVDFPSWIGHIPDGTVFRWPVEAERCQTRTMQKMVLLQVGEQHCWIMSLQYLVFLRTNAWEHINKAVSCL